MCCFCGECSADLDVFSCRGGAIRKLAEMRLIEKFIDLRGQIL
ncbi:TPA: hypothetical protein MEL26_002499 [Klebsiella quasipneumoniae subsp. quasipneumoniae]|nr:hypothetical protein [Klebsiella quasipneumoniae]HBW0872955.1 hypothetical protein [Klebsiella quasipneumoniae]HBW2222138.1 hypothetical protein [Klebsiella quasipneumoniae subsp. quasipneumoniae]